MSAEPPASGTRYIPRSLETVLRKALREFPAVVVSGPRQAGKTTMLRAVLGDRWRYVSLDIPDVRAAAESDPRGFLEFHEPPVVFDEVQYAPGLLPYLRERIDEARERKGRYVLTGSQDLLLTAGVTETLAGRVAVLRLLPMARREEEREPRRPLPWERRPHRDQVPRLAFRELWETFLRGGYPELVATPGRDVTLWHAGYVRTYLERDVRSLRHVGDLSLFQAFLRVLAARSAQLLNLSDVARDLGVAVNTVRAWLSVLEATHQVIVVRPWFANVGKQLVKRPKVYFTDPGTLCYLSGLRDPEHAAAGPMAGAIFETAVLAEIVRTRVHRGEEPAVWFWRTRGGSEVDFVLEWNGRLVPVEVKASATPRPAMGDGIRRFRAAVGERALPGWVVHTGDTTLPLGNGVTALPFGLL